MVDRLLTLFNFERPIINLKYGGVAQLGEHLPCKQGVRSSNLLISTILEVRGWKLEVRTEESALQFQQKFSHLTSHISNLYGLIAQQARAHA